MAPSRATSLPYVLAMILGIALCLFASPVAASAAQPSPAVDAVDLICHTSNPDECYPRIFEATDEFQTVHDDQEIPHGLHVRINVSSGLKEAKVNVPDEVNAALESLPIDQSIVVVEPQEPEKPEIPKGAPKYEPVGKIKEPGNDPDAKPFFEAMRLLKTTNGHEDAIFDYALEGLEELSHDIYYGLKITEDKGVVKGLFCLMDDGSVDSPEGVVPRDQQAAAILAGALQNNPTALDEVTKEWANLMAADCPRNGKSLREAFSSSFVPAAPQDTAASKASAAKAKAKVAAINGLIKSDKIRKEFLEADGMDRLLEVLIPEGKEWSAAQRKVGQLVLDTFLDEDMGAKLGQWPRATRSSDSECKGGRDSDSATKEGCWDYHVERIFKANKKDSGHWSRDLRDRLAKVRKSKYAPPSREL